MINHFSQLTTWQSGHKLVLEIYRVTKKFPNSEIHSLSDQMRRAVISVTSNIAEGFGRKSEKEKVRFYYLSAGSLTELENQLIISKDLKYITDNDYMLLLDQVNNTIRLLKGLIRSFYP